MEKIKIPCVIFFSNFNLKCGACGGPTVPRTRFQHTQSEEQVSSDDLDSYSFVFVSF